MVVAGAIGASFGFGLPAGGVSGTVTMAGRLALLLVAAAFEV